VYPMTSSRMPCSILLSTTAPDPRRLVQILLVRARSDSRSPNMHTPIISSTYTAVLLRSTCRTAPGNRPGHYLERGWSAGPPEYARELKIHHVVTQQIANIPTSSGRNERRVYAPFRSIFQIRISSHRSDGSRSFAAIQKSYTITAMSSIVGWRISP
jgi:hypothetical protein